MDDKVKDDVKYKTQRRPTSPASITSKENFLDLRIEIISIIEGIPETSNT